MNAEFALKKHYRAKPKMTPIVDEEVILTIQSLSHEGRGVALYDERHAAEQQGKKVFVKFALPHETVKVKLTKKHKRFDEGEVVTVLSEPASQRTVPICEHFGVCGGCAVQHMDVDQQIEYKQHVLASHLQHFAGIQPEQWLAPIRATRQDYRRRARVGVIWREKQKQLIVGFRESKTNQLTPIRHCQVLDTRVGRSFPELTQVLTSLNDPTAITHLEFALGDTEVALILRHVKELVKQDIDKLLDFVKNRHWQLYLLPDQYQRIRRIDGKNATMRLHYVLEHFNLDLAFSPLDFTQVNADVNQQMVSKACDLLNLQHGERVLDLFCGLGNFSLPLARCVGPTGQVVAVEGVEDMVKRGQENAERNHIQNIEFYAQDLSKDFSDQPWANKGFDALLIDPPRAGAEQVMHYVANFAAKRIVYISCDPATLARDAGILVKQGYRLTHAGIMDMFTHTEHVESIALFEKIVAIDHVN